jgi:hypothetical protein
LFGAFFEAETQDSCHDTAWLRLYGYTIPNQQRIVFFGFLIANQEEHEDWFPVL